MSQRYLVTGCAGFIGSRVCQLLLDTGHAVVGWDNLNDAYDVRLKQWRLARLQEQGQFTFRQLDIADRHVVQQHFGHEARDVSSVGSAPYAAVINLAARAGVRPSVENPWVYYEANCVGTLNLLEGCRQHGVDKFVLASTSSLYGADNAVPFREDADTSRPLSPYAASKKAAETLAFTYHHLHGIDVTLLRYFTVYGPAGRPDMSVFRFIRKIAEGEPIVVFGDGSQSRDFTYVEDVARGTMAATRPLGFEVINLGSDRPIVLSDVIDEISELVGRPVKIEYKPAHPADCLATWADIGKAGRLLEWKPQTSFANGLIASVQWYFEHHELATSLHLD